MYCHKSTSRGDKTGMDFHGVFMLKKKTNQTQADLSRTKQD